MAQKKKQDDPFIKKESKAEYLIRNLRAAAAHLPDYESKHMIKINNTLLPAHFGPAAKWSQFLTFIHSWQPIDDLNQTDNGSCDFSVGLNADSRDEEVILKEMETVLYLTSYLNVLVTESRIAVAWAMLDESSQKDTWLSESKGLSTTRYETQVTKDWKAVQKIGKQARDLLFQIKRRK